MRFLDIAVHCHLPPMDGSDLRAWQLYRGMIATGAEGNFIGRTVSVRNLEEPLTHSSEGTWRDRKTVAALAAFATGATYWHYKMIRPGARRAIQEALRDGCDFALLNMLSAFPLAKPLIERQIPLVVDTHNYDPAWFESIAKASRNPLLQHLCRRNVHYVERALQWLPKDTILVHVSDEDAVRTRVHRPDLQHLVIENGANIRPRETRPNYQAPGKKTLMFVGSLSAKMNQDALHHFANHFWPALRDVADFRAVGSAPPNGVRALCEEQGWTLFPNVSGEQLTQLYSEAHYAVLPFAYGEGSKLKFYEACGRGVPVLATRAGLCGVRDVPDLVRSSDDAGDWKQIVATNPGPDDAAVARLIGFAENYSWPRLSQRLVQMITESIGRHADTRHN